MTLDNEQQRSIILQALDIAARTSVTGASDSSLQALVALCEVRLAVQKAAVVPAGRDAAEASLIGGSPSKPEAP